MPDVFKGELLAPLLLHNLLHQIKLGVPQQVLVDNEVYQRFDEDVEPVMLSSRLAAFDRRRLDGNLAARLGRGSCSC